jgi:ATP:ADP antiporter, AAA family
MFGFIWAGASVGGLVGPSIAHFLAVPIGAINLLLLSAGLLLLSLVFMAQIIGWQRRQGVRTGQPATATAAAAPAEAQRGIGGGVFAAFAQVARSPYLLGIAVFVLFMTWVSTFLYLEQAAFLAKVFHNTDDRTRFLSGVDFWVQAASLLLQTLLFSRLFKLFGMRALLVAVPLIMVAGYALFALLPTFAVLIGVYAVRRVADYGITRPCRDSLFTVVSREEKYQAKSLIDTFAYRGGDALSGSLYKALTGPLGFGSAGIGWLGAGVAAAWAVLALALGRGFQRRAAARPN